MSDLINRAETLKAIKKYFRKAIDEIDGEAGFEYISDACEAILKYSLDICKMIEALPSAEPKQPDSGPISCISAEKMHDRTTDGLISRQAAIDALYHVDEYNGRSVEAIRNLPSAQPERKKGKWVRIKASCYQCNQCGVVVTSGFSNFCHRCGSDMRDDFSEHMNEPEEE